MGGRNPLARMLTALLIAATGSCVRQAGAATASNLHGVYDTTSNRLLIEFDVNPAPGGVDSFYFDFDGTPLPSVFDPTTAIEFSSVPGAFIDSFFGQESIYIDFPSVLTTAQTYTVILSVADVSDMAGNFDIDFHLNPHFGAGPSGLPSAAYPDMVTQSAFVPGSVIPEPASLAVLAILSPHLLRRRRHSPGGDTSAFRSLLRHCVMANGDRHRSGLRHEA